MGTAPRFRGLQCMTILHRPMFWKRLKIDDSCSQIARKRGMRRPDRVYSCYRGCGSLEAARSTSSIHGNPTAPTLGFIKRGRLYASITSCVGLQCIVSLIRGAVFGILQSLNDIRHIRVWTLDISLQVIFSWHSLPAPNDRTRIPRDLVTIAKHTLLVGRLNMLFWISCKIFPFLE